MGKKVKCWLINCLYPTYRKVNDDYLTFFKKALIFLQFKCFTLVLNFFLVEMSLGF